MRKGQAAMEYLMTYGWAILIVIVVVAALYAMGVFRIGGTTVPCSPCFGSQFTLIDYGSGILKIRSGARAIKQLDIWSDQTQVGSGNLAGIYFSWTNSSTTVISQGTDLSLGNSTHGFTTGTTYYLTLNYTDTDSGLTHSETATLRA